MVLANLIEGKNYAPVRLGRVLVLGLGKSGKAAAAYCAKLLGSRVESLFIAGGAYSEANEAFLRGLAREGVSYAFEKECFDEHYDLCIVSPGIPETSDFYRNARAASDELIGEMEFSWRECDAVRKWIAVTGTNGKTTTTSLIAHILQDAGCAAVAAGNIGDVCLEEVVAGRADVIVAETSSFQLASTARFSPDIAVLLNITPDHLSWHGSFENYAAAKFKVLDNLGASQVAVMDATDDVVRSKVRELKNMDPAERGFAYIPVGTADGLASSMIERCGSANAAYLRDGELIVEFDGACFDCGAADALQIRGEHNVSNALMAASAAAASGIPAEAIARALASFEPLEHRMEPCGQIAGVSFVNDSKGTNVDATLKALTSYAPGTLVVLLGGRDKNTELDELVAACAVVAHTVICYGEAGPRFADAFEAASCETLSVVRAEHMTDAFEVALSVAKAGDTVLLSPACASFDEFDCFEQRGEVFKDLVRRAADKAPR